MRLICPNCEAQYEVSDDAIPPGGRDVQCSNCQQSWFQTEKPVMPARDALMLEQNEPTAPAPENVPDDVAASVDEYDEPEEDITPSEPNTAPMPDVTEAADAAIAEETAPAAESVPPAEAAAEVTPQEPPKRKPLDDAVANILREEAAFGAAPAAAAAAPIARPPATEAPKTAAPVSQDKTRERIAQMTQEEGGVRAGGEQSDIAAQTDAHMRTIPTINEINATLRARAQASDTSGLTEDEKYAAVQRSGFRRGFFMILIIFAILIAPYIFADQIIENLPQTKDIMTSYVVMIDQLRISLSELVNGLTSG